MNFVDFKILKTTNYFEYLKSKHKDDCEDRLEF